MKGKVVEIELQEIDEMTGDSVYYVDEEDRKRKKTKEHVIYRIELDGKVPGSVRISEEDLGKSMRVNDLIEVTFGPKNVRKV